MRVRIHAYPPLRAALGDGPFDLEVLEGGDLRAVLRALARRASALTPLAAARDDEWLWGRVIVQRGGEMVRLDDPVFEGDLLELLPPIAGGQ